MARALPTRALVAVGLALAVGLAMAVSPFASSAPDGLERVAEDERFLDDRRVTALQKDSPMLDYTLPGIENERVATGLAGFAGTLAVFLLAYALASARRRAGARGRGAGGGRGAGRASRAGSA